LATLSDKPFSQLKRVALNQMRAGYDDNCDLNQKLVKHHMFPASFGAIMPQPNKQKTRRGAPAGNTNALKHGRRTAVAIEDRKRRNAQMKAAGLLLSRQGWLTHRCRCKPVRPDQIRFLPPGWMEIVAPLYAKLLKGKPTVEKG